LLPEAVEHLGSTITMAVRVYSFKDGGCD